MLAGNSWDWLIYPSIYRLEWCLLAGVGAAVIMVPRRFRLFRPVIREFDRLAANRRAAILAVIVAAMLGRAALLPILPIPRPGIHDEFAFLLTTDTFLHGRLTNPTNPMWVHFEMFHTFHVPTYQSQYPIGYPVVMAAAWALFGNPWWGVFVTTGLMCGALVWMLQGWLPPRWALLGGLFAVIRVGLFSYWMNSYFGGSLAALGGCLFFGALPRIVPGVGRRNAGQSSPELYSFLCAVGLVMLANSRPFEGLLVTVPGIVVILYFLPKQRKDPKAVMRVLLPALSVLAISLAAMLIYQKAVTGYALKSPYTVVLEQYRITRPLFFEELLPAHHYHFPEFRHFYVHFEPMYRNDMGNLWGFLQVTRDRLELYWKFFAGPILTIPLFMCVSRIRVKRLRLVWLSAGVLMVGLFLESFLNDHYCAPAYPLFVLLVLEGLRKLQTIRIGPVRLGQRLVFILPVLCILMASIRVVAFDEQQEEILTHWPPNWAFSTQRLPDRDRVADLVEQSPDKALIIVRYRFAFHNFHEEWVNNGADLEHAKVLWARSMSAKENCELAQYYADRKFWVVDNWGSVAKLTPESAAQICDPENTIYERNYPIEQYLGGASTLPKTRSFLKAGQTY